MTEEVPVLEFVGQYVRGRRATLAFIALALAWFAAAVRSKPELATREGVEALATSWQDDERRTLEDVYEAWAAKPKG